MNPLTHDLYKLVSIVIPVYGNVEYTRKCVESIQAHVRQNYEIIIIDNASTDNTIDYLRSAFKGQLGKPPTVIRNKTNVGVPAAYNQGFNTGTGDFFLFLNNDTIVPVDAIENMVRWMLLDKEIGIVGPRTNYVSGPQIVKDTGINTEHDIHKFADSWHKEMDRSSFEYPRIVGFCMMIRRRCYDKVGYFDEQFGLGNFEDDDYCLRAKQAGFKLLVANDAFVYHFGSVTCRQFDFAGLLKENEIKFNKKHRLKQELYQ